MQRLLATPEPVEIVEEDIDDVLLVAARLAARMRRDEYIPRGPEGRGGRQRLLDEDVEGGGGDGALLQRRDERRLLDAATTREVGEKRGRPHQRERFGVDDVLRLRR